MFTLLRFLFTGWMLRILLVLALIGVLYYYKIWPFRQNVATLSFLENKYCKSETPENKAICDCIVARLKPDINSRFNARELDSLEKDRLKMAYVLEKSMTAIKPFAMQCLEKRQQPGAWRTFSTDLASLDNPYLKKAGDFLNSGVDKVKQKWNERQAEKDSIDSRY